MRVPAVLALLVIGCARADGAPRGSAGRDDAPRTPSAVKQETARKAETSPEIIARAEKILSEHGDAPVGTEIPFTLNGKRYVARVEIHDNPDASPGRPPGEHKGITVYLAP
jgi:hypothetical protein